MSLDSSFIIGILKSGDPSPIAIKLWLGVGGVVGGL
jgi:hypothetical protein